MSNITNYQEAINYLKTSPMFNLSLASKELFHSNFLYWLSIIDKQLFKNLIEELGVETAKWPKDDTMWDVKREFNNFDLSVVVNDKILLVIENKVKSIPTHKQLEEYDEKIKKVNKEYLSKENKLLLSLTKPNFKTGSWTWVEYGSICKYLKKYTQGIDGYYKHLIQDYTKFIEALLIIVTNWENSSQDNSRYLLDYKVKEYSDQEIKEDAYNSSDICELTHKYYHDAKELRIHDLYGKYRTILLVEKLKEILSKNRNIKAQGIKIEPQMAYTRSQPIFEVKITGIGEVGSEDNKIEPEAFFISIQGEQYRHAINTRCSDNANKEIRKEDSIERIRKQGKKWNWFMNPDIHPKDNESFYPANKILNKSSQRNNICSYSGSGRVYYIYQYKNINKNSTIKDVLKAMVDDIKNIVNQLNTINKA